MQASRGTLELTTYEEGYTLLSRFDRETYNIAHGEYENHPCGKKVLMIYVQGEPPKRAPKEAIYRVKEYVQLYKDLDDRSDYGSKLYEPYEDDLWTLKFDFVIEATMSSSDLDDSYKEYLGFRDLLENEGKNDERLPGTQYCKGSYGKALRKIIDAILTPPEKEEEEVVNPHIGRKMKRK